MVCTKKTRHQYFSMYGQSLDLSANIRHVGQGGRVCGWAEEFK